MAKATRALVIGRFQPPHEGHLALITAAAELAQQVIVVVGSAQESHSATNPLTAGERLGLLRAVVAERELPVTEIVPVEDIGRYPLWVDHVSTHVSDYDLVVTANPMTAHLFESAGRTVHRIEPRSRDRWEGTTIRRALLAGEAEIEGLPPLVAKALSVGEIAARLRAIAATQDGRSG